MKIIFDVNKNKLLISREKKLAKPLKYLKIFKIAYTNKQITVFKKNTTTLGSRVGRCVQSAEFTQF